MPDFPFVVFVTNIISERLEIDYLTHMKNKIRILFVALIVGACSKKEESISPTIGTITESIYASGNLKSQDQYQAFVTVNGVINDIFVQEGDSVHIGTPLLSIAHETQQLNLENAKLNEDFSSLQANQGRLQEAKAFAQTAKAKLNLDSSVYIRQKALWAQQIGTRIDFEQKELAYQNSRTNYLSANQKLSDLSRQIKFNAAQAKKGVQLSGRLAADFTLRSKIDGIVLSLLKEKGEIVNSQTPIAILGNAHAYVLELQVDEKDIFNVSLGQKVILSFDAFKNEIFEAKVVRLAPIMNERNKTFLVEAKFTKAPKKLFPNVSFEANIMLRTKHNALILPRNYIKNDSLVTLADGSIRVVKLGLTDFQKAEVLHGISRHDAIIKPKE